jgi:hypothetical protein
MGLKLTVVSSWSGFPQFEQNLASSGFRCPHLLHSTLILRTTWP